MTSESFLVADISAKNLGPNQPLSVGAKDGLAILAPMAEPGRWTTQDGSVDIRRATPDDAERVLHFWRDSGASMSVTDEPEYVRLVTQHPSAVLLLAVLEARLSAVWSEPLTVGVGISTAWWSAPSIAPRHCSTARSSNRGGVLDVGCQALTVLVEVDRPWAAEFWNAMGYPPDKHIVRRLGLLEPPSDGASERLFRKSRPRLCVYN